jgi:hypothetical protein
MMRMSCAGHLPSARKLQRSTRVKDPTPHISVMCVLTPWSIPLTHHHRTTWRTNTTTLRSLSPLHMLLSHHLCPHLLTCLSNGSLTQPAMSTSLPLDLNFLTFIPLSAHHRWWCRRRRDGEWDWPSSDMLLSLWAYNISKSSCPTRIIYPLGLHRRAVVYLASFGCRSTPGVNCYSQEILTVACCL